MDFKDKFLGGLYGAAIGDAMGAATETRSYDAIQKDFGCHVSEIMTPPEGCYATGNKAGQVTDDFSQAFLLLKEVIENDGEISEFVTNNALIKWAEYPQYFKCCGNTTKTAIDRITGEPIRFSRETTNICDNFRASNGAGMRIGAISMLKPDEIDSAIDNAIVVSMRTHDNPPAVSASCAIAAATSKAMGKNNGLLDILKAGLYGAEEGFNRVLLFARPAASASILKRMHLAIEIGERYCGRYDLAMREIADVIGCGYLASESIPAVFGIMVACKGDPMQSITMAVNAGNDSDTVATMVGAILGAWKGASVFPENMKRMIDEANPFDLKNAALKAERLILEGKIWNARRMA